MEEEWVSFETINESGAFSSEGALTEHFSCSSCNELTTTEYDGKFILPENIICPGNAASAKEEQLSFESVVYQLNLALRELEKYQAEIGQKDDLIRCLRRQLADSQGMIIADGLKWNEKGKELVNEICVNAYE